MEQTQIHLRFRMIGAVAIVIGGIAWMSGGFEATSYFYGWVFWACMTFGCLGVSLLHHMAKGSWGYPVMRLLEAGGGWKMLLLFGLLFVPILSHEWMGKLYEHWMHEGAMDNPLLAQKEFVLNERFFTVFSVFVFATFIFWAYRNQKWQRLEDETGDKKYLRWRTNWSSGFFPFFMILINFAFTFWVMSMRPEWFSTMYGIWFAIQQALAAMAMVAIIIGTQAKKEPFKRVVTPQLTKDLGNLMLVMTMLWAYFSFSQYLIIWSGNMPETISYYMERRANGFDSLGAVLIAFGFFVPFLLLLRPRMKSDPRNLAIAGTVILIGRFLDMHYNVAPMFRDTVVPQLADVGALLVFGGVWCYMFGWTVAQAPLLVKNQPQLEEAVEHARPA